MTVTMLEIGNPLREDAENVIRKLDGATKDTVALRAYDVALPLPGQPLTLDMTHRFHPSRRFSARPIPSTHDRLQ